MPNRFFCAQAVALGGGVCILLSLGAAHAAGAAALLRDDSDAVFAGTNLPRFRIEVPADGMQVLEGYHQVWGQPRPGRVDVSVTVREGSQVYTNVSLHLKGSYTFQPIGSKPSLTLN